MLSPGQCRPPTFAGAGAPRTSEAAELCVSVGPGGHACRGAPPGPGVAGAEAASPGHDGGAE
eukprot:8464476-Alexandrium_andersonii.AAC.1